VLSCGSKVNGIRLSENGYVDVNAYYSIPFATAARFTHSSDVVCNPSAVINATQLGPVCYQFGAPRPPTRVQSDDCLLLDIYTPVNATTTSALQVFFWIHGGGNCFGSSTLYTGLSHFTAMDNVVVVSVQYRLGAYGYLATSELSREQSGFSGNYGIADLISALRFVNKEIVNFGGDATRVTLFGQSSGGTNIFALLAARAADGLFAAAVSLSGSPNITMTLAFVEQQNAFILQSLNWSCTTPQCLRAASPNDIVNALTVPLCAEPLDLPKDRARGVQWPGMVVVDGNVVTQGSLKAAGAYKVPVVIGTMSNEAELLIDLSTVPSTFVEFEQRLAAAMQQWPAANTTAQHIADMYSTRSILDAYTGFLSDYSIACGSLALAAAGSSAVVDVYTTASPANPTGFVTSPTESLRLPFHMWDFIMALRSWDIFSVDDAKIAPYHPFRSDVSAGDALRKLWLSLDSQIDPNYCVSTSKHRQCLNDVTYGGRVIVETNKSTDTVFHTCAAFEAIGLSGLRWWWTN